MKFYDFAVIWRDAYLGRKDISIRVKEEYWDILNNRVFEYFDDIQIESVDAAFLDGFINQLADKGYAAKTIRNTFSVIKSILKYAYRKKYITENPVDRMDDLPCGKCQDGIHYFTPIQCKIFLGALKKERKDVEAFFNILLYGGLRRGELCALKWRDVDFQNMTIKVSSALSLTHSGIVEKLPKTKASVRTICLPKCCFDLLCEVYAEVCDKLTEDEVFNYDSYIFQNSRGCGPVRPQVQTNRFRRILKNYNESSNGDKLPYIRLHDLRHTAATLLIAGNVDIETVAKRLGHSNVAVTLNVYGHATVDADRRAGKVLEKIIGQ